LAHFFTKVNNDLDIADSGRHWFTRNVEGWEPEDEFDIKACKYLKRSDTLIYSGVKAEDFAFVIAGAGTTNQKASIKVFEHKHFYVDTSI